MLDDHRNTLEIFQSDKEYIYTFAFATANFLTPRRNRPQTSCSLFLGQIRFTIFNVDQAMCIRLSGWLGRTITLEESDRLTSYLVCGKMGYIRPLSPYQNLYNRNNYYAVQRFYFSSKKRKINGAQTIIIIIGIFIKI